MKFSRKVQQGVRDGLPPLLFLIAVLMGWELIVWGFRIPEFVLPGPRKVLLTLLKDSKKFSTAFIITGSAALGGLLMSLVLGTIIGFFFSLSSLIRRCVYPYALFLQTVPVLAIAPLMILWFGRGFHSIMLVAFILSLFPMITNATAGMTALDPDLVALFRLHNASWWQFCWKLRFPTAVPSLITGAKISCGLAVVGAIVGEFYMGSMAQQSGFGTLIGSASFSADTPFLMATVVSTTLLGLSLFGSISWIGQRILEHWFIETEA